METRVNAQIVEVCEKCHGEGKVNIGKLNTNIVKCEICNGLGETYRDPTQEERLAQLEQAVEELQRKLRNHLDKN